MTELGRDDNFMMLPSDTPFSSEATVLLSSLLPATNYSVRSLAVYPNEANDSLYSEPAFFTTTGVYQ